MRILIISDHADPLAEIGSKETGGQNIYVLYLTKFLSRLGVFVDVYTRWDRRNKKEVVRVNNHARIIRVKAGPKKYIPRDTFLEVIDEFYRHVLERIEKERLDYDIIHTNYWFSGIIGLRLAAKLDRPLVHVFHSIGKIRYRALKSLKELSCDNVFFAKRIRAEKRIAEEATFIISTSPVEKQIIKKMFKISSKKIKYIPIGVETEIFKPFPEAYSRKKLRLEEAGKIVVYVGRIEWRKGIGTLLFAFKEVLKTFPDTRLYVIGGGRTKAAAKLDNDECERLRGIARDLGVRDHVRFLGAKKQLLLRHYYSMADATVVPSYYEPFGIVPLESMACGTPVVASRTGGLKFTVKNGETGYLATPRNYQDTARKIIKVLKKGKKFYYYNCLNRIETNFLWSSVAEQYLAFFNSLRTKK